MPFTTTEVEKLIFSTRAKHPLLKSQWAAILEIYLTKVFLCDWRFLRKDGYLNFQFLTISNIV